MATNDVVLGAAMRQNLLSLQNTQRSIDSTQLRLATGKKVNSALDNPQSFFTAQSLNNRASDLTRLLDGIGQSIRAIEEADKGVTALTKLVEQQSAIVQSARDELLASEGQARTVGDGVNLSSVTTLIGLGGIANGDQFTIQTVDDTNTAVSQTITIATGDTAYSLAAKITNAFKDNAQGEVVAKVNSNGYLDISSTAGRTFRIEDTAGGTAVSLAGFQALGFSNFSSETIAGVATAATTVVAGDTLKSISLYEGTGDLAEAGDVLVGRSYTNTNGTAVLAGLAVGDTVAFAVNGAVASTATVTIAANTTFQDIVDEINQTAGTRDLVEASFNSQTGSFEIKSISGDTRNIEIRATAAATGLNFNVGFGDPSGLLDPIAALGAAGTIERQYAFSTSSNTLERLAGDYNKIRTQIDDLVKDANYRGVNLLAGDNQTTYFNETRSSSITVEGGLFTADGLGLAETTFANSTVIDQADDQVRAALESVRAFGSSLANSLSVIQTRRDFTEQTISTLKAGASDLTDADLNEEGANLLALQTAQQLGVTSLSLASQSQQSVLRLF